MPANQQLYQSAHMALLKGHSHKKIHMFFLFDSAENNEYKICSTHFIAKFFDDKRVILILILIINAIAFSNRIYNLCTPRVLIVLFICAFVTGVLVYYSNL